MDQGVSEVETSDLTRSDHWMVTIMDNHADEVESLKQAERIRWVGQWEIAPSTGKKHWQGYVALDTRMRRSQLKKLLPTAHLELRRGKEWQAIGYCTKDETRVKASKYETNFDEEYIEECREEYREYKLKLESLGGGGGNTTVPAARTPSPPPHIAVEKLSLSMRLWDLHQDLSNAAITIEEEHNKMLDKLRGEIKDLEDRIYAREHPEMEQREIRPGVKLWVKKR